MNKIKRLLKWAGSRDGSDRLLTIACIAIMIFLFVIAIVVEADAHGIHLEDVDLGKLEHSGYADGGMYVRTAKGEFFLYKHIDLVHSGMHVIQMEEYEYQCETDTECMDRYPELGDY